MIGAVDLSGTDTEEDVADNENPSSGTESDSPRSIGSAMSLTSIEC